ncbi:hypothetical protein [Tessaracoccus sp. MC1756]|uniref:hypothetical protein n=1 Tax=Tessaracoccus sp. MC1756 TaxID=2760311 RepID=UPI0015FEC42D|nr:hypothetical protein [Tessaracoccus sp. MC1756]MBB1510421.1 hypothetical protein [Tessaracoccus sp. MC1756]
MAVILLTSATGAPGVTTASLGLALTWPRHVLLADCDREPGQSVQAGYLRGMDHGGRGLMSLAHLNREGSPLAPELWRQTLPLVDGGDVQRRFLPGFTSPGASRLFEHVWPVLGEALESLDGQGVDVLIDAGRLSTGGLPLGLLSAADVVLLTLRSSLRSLAGARIHLPTLNDQVAALPQQPAVGLAVVGAGRPYSTSEIAAQFAVPVWAEVPWEPKSADVLSDGEREPRRFFEGSFMGRLRADAKAVSDRLSRARQAATLVSGGTR